jgi:hypothetical protein
MKKYSFPVDGIGKLAPQSALSLTRLCLNNRPNFVFSVAKSMEEIKIFTKNYDNSIVNIISQTFSILLELNNYW